MTQNLGFRVGIVCVFLVSAMSRAGSLPTGLSVRNINRVTEVIAGQSITRALRAAEPYATFPGVRIGGEICLVPTQDLANLGDQNSSISNSTPLPRLHLTKGLVENMELVFSLFPASLDNGISSIGGMLKATLQHEFEFMLEVGFFVGFTHVTAFHGGFSGNVAEMGLLFSKDYVRLKPFIGGSILGLQGSVANQYAAASPDSQARLRTHAFLGMEVELPVNLTVQADLIGLDFSGTLFVGKKF